MEEKIYPLAIRQKCYNPACAEEVLFKLYKGLDYRSTCTRCGIEVIIDKFSPFIQDIATQMKPAHVAEVTRK